MGLRQHPPQKCFVPIDKHVREMPLLGHEKICQFSHRAFRLRDSLFHERDTLLRLFDGPLQGLALFHDDGQKLLTKALKGAFTSCSNQASARAFDQSIERRYQLFPVPSGSAVLQPFCSTHLKKRPHRMLESLFELPSCEGDGRGPFRFGSSIRLVQNEYEIPCVLRDGLNQREFFPASGGSAPITTSAASM